MIEHNCLRIGCLAKFHFNDWNFDECTKLLDINCYFCLHCCIMVWMNTAQPHCREVFSICMPIHVSVLAYIEFTVFHSVVFVII